ncbi:hypothetical protein GE061_010682 [Apolygus lucorum]|uniref:F-box domain-containing protein n=1 Tax=Apolygus lucorum TaxID=248454 RepID=A0A8S9XWR2_APOLU|nr:hypothetical protein GE061_010682 [Apolygus lucorum]
MDDKKRKNGQVDPPRKLKNKGSLGVLPPSVPSQGPPAYTSLKMEYNEDFPHDTWLIIFSYLDLKDLCTARSVCKSWWQIINCDILWKPFALKRGIYDHFAPETQSETETQETDIGRIWNWPPLGGDMVKGLQNCKWAELTFTYYEKITTNCEHRRCKLTEFTPYAYFGTTPHVCMPYLLRAANPKVVEILELHQGDFIPFQTITLPDSPIRYRNPYVELHSNGSNIVVISSNNYSLIYKLRNRSFRFEKALFWLPGHIMENCLDENELQSCLQRHQLTSNARYEPFAVSDDYIWIAFESETFGDKPSILAWNHTSSERVHHLRSSHTFRSSNDHVVCSHESRFHIYSIDGTMLWEHIANVDICGYVDVGKLGCGIVFAPLHKKVAIYVDLKTKKAIDLAVVEPTSIVIQEVDHLAYCMCMPMKTNHLIIACANFLTGDLLWQCTVGYRVFPKVTYAPKMRIVHGKFIFVHGLYFDFKDKAFFEHIGMSMFSTTDGNLVWSHSFGEKTFKVQLLNDHLILRLYLDFTVLTWFDGLDVFYQIPPKRGERIFSHVTVRITPDLIFKAQRRIHQYIDIIEVAVRASFDLDLLSRDAGDDHVLNMLVEPVLAARSTCMKALQDFREVLLIGDAMVEFGLNDDPALVQIVKSKFIMLRDCLLIIHSSLKVFNDTFQLRSASLTEQIEEDSIEAFRRLGQLLDEILGYCNDVTRRVRPSVGSNNAAAVEGAHQDSGADNSASDNYVNDVIGVNSALDGDRHYVIFIQADIDEELEDHPDIGAIHVPANNVGFTDQDMIRIEMYNLLLDDHQF